MYSFAVPTIEGIFAGVSRLIGNGMAIGFKMTFRGDGCFCVEWLWYLLTIGTLLSWFSQLKWLNRGLARFSPVYMMPIGFTSSTFISTSAGLLVFGEWDEFSGPTSIILFGIGFMIIFGGVIALTQSPESRADSSCNAKKKVVIFVDVEASPENSLKTKPQRRKSEKHRLPVLLLVPIPCVDSVTLDSPGTGLSSDKLNRTVCCTCLLLQMITSTLSFSVFWIECDSMIRFDSNEIVQNTRVSDK